MVPPARIERADVVLRRNVRFRLNYGGDGAREGGLELPLALRVTKKRCSTLSYAGKRNSQTAGTPRPKKIALPETTVCRPTEGDQYRISGPSYVLAGTAILNSKTLHVITRPRERPRFSAG